MSESNRPDELRELLREAEGSAPFPEDEIRRRVRANARARARRQLASRWIGAARIAASVAAALLVASNAASMRSKERPARTGASAPPAVTSATTRTWSMAADARIAGGGGRLGSPVGCSGSAAR